METLKTNFPILSEDIKSILRFINALDDLKLPEDVGRVFFEELINKGECVCGDELTEEKFEKLDKWKKF